MLDAAPEPKYPGDAIRLTRIRLRRDPDYEGEVRIMDYGRHSASRYRVAEFCPGSTVCVEGDTPKTEPTSDHWCYTLIEAERFFDVCLAYWLARGWEEFK